MLGELIYEAKGKITGYRVLDVEGPKIEVTISENGTLKGGIETTDIVTYWSISKPGGAYYAEGKGYKEMGFINAYFNNIGKQNIECLT